MTFDPEKVWAAVVASVATGIGWLIRRVLTNEKQIALLQAELKRGREDMREVKGDVKKLLERKPD